MLRAVGTIDNQEISYTLIRKPVKNINLRIKADLSVSVSANNQISEKQVDAFVISKSEFILKALNKFKVAYVPMAELKKYVSGESFCVLGNDIRLKVIKSNANKVFFDGVYLMLETKNINSISQKEKQILMWYKEQREQIFTEIARNTHKDFVKHNIEFPKIRQREMKSRWGSCMPKKGVITLNTKLFEMPRNCVEYVIMHEFCHFLMPNHSKAFYTLLGTMMPDWKERKKQMENRNYLNFNL